MLDSKSMRIREAASHRDLDEVCLIQREVWNGEDLEIVGRLHLQASQHAGASVLIAETEDGLIAGFAYAFPAYVHGKVFWHSDMLGVRPRFRSSGVGQRLKWAQRDHALRVGVRRITWTFDPMQAGNAHLNLTLLGATVREYVSNFYGVTTSALHHGLPTDRLVASWALQSPRVAALSRGEEPVDPLPEQATVAIPKHWNELVGREPDSARIEQQRVERELGAAFARGLVATGFDKTRTAYVLTSPEPQ